MRRILLGLGSNQSPDSNLPAMIRQLADHCGDLVISSIIVTTPDGKAYTAPFHNAVALITSAASLQEIKATTVAIEKSLGRKKSPEEKQQGRIPADIDILNDDVDQQPVEIKEPFYALLADELLHFVGLRTAPSSPDPSAPKVSLCIGMQEVGLAPAAIAGITAAPPEERGSDLV